MSRDLWDHDIAGAVPDSLAAVDELLGRYGRWATTSSRGGSAGYTMERRFHRAADRHESLAAFDRRREAAYGRATQLPLLQTSEAMAVQRAMALVPWNERQVLAALYIPRRLPAVDQLKVLRVPPALSRERHLRGLRMLANLLRAGAGKGRP